MWHGKSDIGALLLWKRLRADTRWARQLMNMPDVEVRARTAQAVDAVRDPNVAVPTAARVGRRLLSPIPGFTPRRERGEQLVDQLAQHLTVPRKRSARALRRV